MFPLSPHRHGRTASTAPLRSLADRISARRRRAHRALQLALRAQVRRRVPAPHRGHRQGAQHRREHARDLRRDWSGSACNWDDAVVYQGANLERHRADATALLENGTAYRCFCTQEELAERRAAAESRKEAFKYDRRCDRLDPAEIARRVAAGMPFTVRFRVPEGTTSGTTSSTGRSRSRTRTSRTSSSSARTGRRSTTSPSCPTTSRWESRSSCAATITSRTRRSRSCSTARSAPPLPTFAHLPMIHGIDGKKLSKRHGATAVGDYQHLGILPQRDAQLPRAARLVARQRHRGHDGAADDRAVRHDGLSKKAAIFDTKKLEWMNGQHLQPASADELAPRHAGARRRGLDDRGGARVAARVVSSRCSTCSRCARARSTTSCVRRRPISATRSSTTPDAVAKQWKDRAGHGGHSRGVRDALAALPEWEPAAMEDALRTIAEQLGFGEKAGKLFQPLARRAHRTDREPGNLRRAHDARPRPVAGAHRCGGALSQSRRSPDR